MRIVISSSASALTAALLNTNSATVEAEYGDVVVQGSIVTLAHHGARASRPCPGALPNLPEMGVEVVGLSHIDLDTVGGVMAVAGIKPDYWPFWASAAFVDTNGVHRLGECNQAAEAVASWDAVTREWTVTPVTVDGKVLTNEDLLNAWWAFSESTEGRVYPPRDGGVADVYLSRHFAVIGTLLEQEEGFSDLIRKGQSWAAAKAALEADSFVGTAGDVVVRSSDNFVNHLYGHGNVVYKAVVGFNSKTGAVTVSLAAPLPGVSCKVFVQTIWTDRDEKGNFLAGGHLGIAGSPRNRVLTLEDAKEVAIEFDKLLG